MSHTIYTSSTNGQKLSWINKIELGFAHGWNEITKSYLLQSKLAGQAKLGHNELSDYSKT